MNYNQIDDQPMKPGWGLVFLGGRVDNQIHSLPGPLAIVCMDFGEYNEVFIDHKQIETVISVWIQDDPHASLSPRALVADVDAGIAFLRQGFNLYVHCQAGHSRGPYYVIALRMRALGESYDQAYQAVHTKRPVAIPNRGFVLSLQNLQSTLQKV